MRIPRRLRRQSGRYALVDGIPYQLPVDSRNSPALVAAFPINVEKAKKLLPGNELHPVRVFGRGVLLLTVVDYQSTDIGRYVEYITTIACTHGPRPAPPLLPFVFRRLFGFGGYVYDMPVSTEISVKGGKGIWGTPKVQANLDFNVTGSTITSQYDLDGELAMRIEMRPPKSPPPRRPRDSRASWIWASARSGWIPPPHPCRVRTGTASAPRSRVRGI